MLLLLGQVYLKQDKPRDARDTFRRLTLQYPNGSFGKQAQVYLDYITERFKELPAPTLKPDFDVGRQRTFCPNILGKAKNYKDAAGGWRPAAKPEVNELVPGGLARAMRQPDRLAPSPSNAATPKESDERKTRPRGVGRSG